MVEQDDILWRIIKEAIEKNRLPSPLEWCTANNVPLEAWCEEAKSGSLLLAPFTDGSDDIIYFRARSEHTLVLCNIIQGWEGL